MVNNISLDIYVQTLTPIEFVNTEDVITKEQREEETGEKLSSQRPELSKDHESLILENLEKFGEDLDDQWELVEETNVVDGQEEQMLGKLKMFADTADAEDKSKEDKGLYKLRYKYDGNPNAQRAFCQAMMSRNTGTKHGLLYRLEDINELCLRVPRENVGKKGANTLRKEGFFQD